MENPGIGRLTFQMGQIVYLFKRIIAVVHLAKKEIVCFCENGIAFGFWVYLINVTGSSLEILSTVDESASSMGFQIRYNSYEHKITFSVFRNGSKFEISTLLPDQAGINNWMHVAGSWNREYKFQLLWLNANLRNITEEETTSSSSELGGRLRIGSTCNGSFKIDELFIRDKSFSFSDVLNMQDTLIKPVDNVITLNFDDIYEGSILSGLPFVSAPAYNLQLSEGKSNSAIKMKNAVLNIGSFPDCFGQGKDKEVWCPDGFTLHFWFKVVDFTIFPHEIMRLFGNSDFNMAFTGFGIYIDRAEDNGTPKNAYDLFLIIFKKKHYLKYRIGEISKPEWFEIILTFDHILGGFSKTFENKVEFIGTRFILKDKSIYHQYDDLGDRLESFNLDLVLGTNTSFPYMIDSFKFYGKKFDANTAEQGFENIGSVEDGVIFDRGGYSDDEYGYGIYILNKMLVIRLQTKYCYYEYSREVLLGQWFHLHFSHEELTIGLRVRINSFIVGQEKICKPRTYKERTEPLKQSLGYLTNYTFSHNDFMFYKLYVSNSSEKSPLNDTKFIGETARTYAYTVTFCSFETVDSYNYVSGKKNYLMNIDENQPPVQFKLYENAKLDYGSVLFHNYLNLSDGYAISSTYYRHCFTHPEYCANAYFHYSFWLKLSASSYGTHFWVGNGNFTFLKVSSTDQNINITARSKTNVCYASSPVQYDKWLLVQISVITDNAAFKIAENITFELQRKKQWSLCYDEVTEWTSSDEGYMVFGADYSDNVISDKGKAAIDDLFLYFDGNYNERERGQSDFTYVGVTCSDFRYEEYFKEFEIFRLSSYKYRCKFPEDKEKETITELESTVGHNWTSITTEIKYSDFYSTSSFRGAVQHLLLTSKKSLQYFTIKCLENFQLFNTLSNTYYETISRREEKLPGAISAGTCPCRNKNECENVNAPCNCDGINSNTTDEGSVYFDHTKEESISNSEVPFKAVRVQESHSITTGFAWKVSPLIGIDDGPLGFYFPLDDSDTNNMDQRFIYHPTNFIKVEDEGHTCWKVDSNGLTIDSTKRNVKCFKNINDCIMGFSLAFWVKYPQKIYNQQTIMLNLNPDGFQIEYKSGKIIFAVYQEGNYWENSIETSIDNWIHIMVSWHPILGSKLYLNNIDTITMNGEYKTMTDKTHSCVIYGCSFNRLGIGRNLTDNSFYMDEFYFSQNVIYTKENRLKIYQSLQIDYFHFSFDNLTALPTYWNGTNLKQINEPIENGLQVDELLMGHRVTCPVSLSFCPNGFTIAFWYKFNMEETASQFFQLGKNIKLNYDGDSTVTLSSIYFNDILYFHTSKGSWHHLFITLNSTMVEVLVNGRLVNSSYVTNSTNNDFTSILTFNGNQLGVDDLHLFTTSVNQSVSKLLSSQYRRSYSFPMDNVTYPIKWKDSGKLVDGLIGKAILVNETTETFVKYSTECLSTIAWCFEGFTLSFWINLRQTTSTENLLLEISNSVIFSYNRNDKMIIIKIREETETLLIQTTFNILEWNHIALSYNNDSIVLFINNILITNGNLSKIISSGSAHQPSPLRIGGNLIIDELKFDESSLNYRIINDTYEKGLIWNRNLSFSMDNSYGFLNGQQTSGTNSTSGLLVKSGLFSKDATKFSLNGQFKIDNLLKDTCFRDITLCSGFSLSVFVKLDENYNKTVILNSSLVNFVCDIFNESLPLRKYCKIEIISSNKVWTSIYRVKFGVYFHLFLSWNLQDDLSVYVDGLLLERLTPIPKLDDKLYTVQDIIIGDGSSEFEIDELEILNGKSELIENVNNEIHYEIGCLSTISSDWTLMGQVNNSLECRRNCKINSEKSLLSDTNSCYCSNLTLINYSVCNGSYSTVYRTCAFLPFINPERIINFNATVNDHYSIDNEIFINVNETFTFNLTTNENTFAMFRINLTNDVIHFTYIRDFEYKYSITGEFIIESLARNEKNDVILRQTIQVITPRELIRNLTIQGPTTFEFNSTQTFTYSAIGGGTMANCSIFINNILQGSMFVKNLTKITTYVENFTKRGLNELKLICNNKISKEEVSLNISIIETIKNLTIQPFWLMDINDPKNISWKVESGNLIEYSLHVNESFIVKTWDNFYLFDNFMNETDSYIIDIYAKNNYSTAYVNATARIERKISYFRIYSNGSYYKTNETFDVFINLTGSNVWQDISFESYSISKFIPGDQVEMINKYQTNFSSPGYYLINGSARNDLSSINALSEYIFIQIPLGNASLDAFNVTHYQKGINVNLTSDNLATNVTVILQYKKFDSPSFDICQTSFINEFNYEKLTCTPINQDGFYYFKAEMSNRVSTKQIINDEIIRIGTPIGNISIDQVTPLIAKTSDTINIGIRITDGSNVKSRVFLGSIMKIKSHNGLVNGYFQYYFQNNPIGIFNITLVVSNNFGIVTSKYNTTVEIQKEIQDFQPIGPFIFDLTDSKIIRWKISQGYPINATAYIDNMPVFVEKENDTHFSVNASSYLLSYRPEFKLFIDNKVSNLITFSKNLTVTKRIEGLNLQLPKALFKTNETVNCTLSFKFGININVEILTNSTLKIPTAFRIEDGKDYEMKFSIQGPQPGYYRLTINCWNSLGNASKSIYFQTFNDVIDFNIMADNVSYHWMPVEIFLAFPSLYAFPSDMEIIVLFGDEKASSAVEKIDEYNYKISHIYQEDGYYKISIQTSNPVGNSSTSKTVQVGQGISSLSFSLPTKSLILNQTYTISCQITDGSNVSLSIDYFGERESVTYRNATTNNIIPINFTYNRIGVYKIGLRAFNLFTDIDKIIENLFVEELIKKIEVIKTIYSSLSDDRAIIRWNISDGNPLSCRLTYKDISIWNINENCNKSSKIDIQAPSQVGSHIYNFTTWNHLSFLSESIELIRIREIESISIKLIGNYFPKGETVNISVIIEKGSNFTALLKSQFIKNIKTFVYKGDNSDKKHYWLNYRFHNLGQTNLSLKVTNILGEKTVEKSIFIQDRIKEVFMDVNNLNSFREAATFEFYTKNSSISIEDATIKLQTGDGSLYEFNNININISNNYTIKHSYKYEREYDIKAIISNKISSITRNVIIQVGECIKNPLFLLKSANFTPGSLIQFTLNITEGSNVTLAIYINNNFENIIKMEENQAIFEKIFKNQGKYNITAKFQNNFCSVSKWLAFSIEERIEGIKLQLMNTPLVGSPLQFQFSYSNLGLEPCLIWDFDDSGPRYIYGRESCRQNDANAILKEFNYERNKLTHNHIWRKAGLYNIFVYGFNSVSRITKRLSVRVIECQKPFVDISGIGKTLDEALVVFRSEKLSLQTIIESRCTEAYPLDIKWKVFKDGVELFKINTTLPWLNIPSNVLPYGIIFFEVNVKITEFEGVENTARKYIKVLPTPLDIKLSGGSGRAVRWNDVLYINASSSVVDSDGSSVNEFMFTWKRKNDKRWTILGKQTLASSRRKKRSVCNFGCLETIADQQGTIDIQVEVTQGSRKTSVKQSMVVMDAAFIPSITLKCLINCKRKMNPSNRLTYASECLNCPVNSVWQYKWELFGEFENGTHRINIDDKFVTDKNSKDFSLKGGVVHSGYKYKLKLTMHNSQSYGFIEQAFITNYPPYNGMCKVEPNQIISLIHKLKVECSNWADEGLQLTRSPADDFFQNRKLVYQTFLKQNSDWILLHTSEESSTPPMHLPVNPNTEIKVKIIDSYDAFKEVFLIAHVQPFTAGLQEIHSLIKGSSSELKFSTLSKNFQANLRIQNAIAGHLNYKPPCSPNNNLNITDRKQLRKDLIETFSNTSIWLETSSALRQGASTLNQLIYETNEISSDSARETSDLLLKMATKLSTINDDIFEDALTTAKEISKIIAKCVEKSYLSVPLSTNLPDLPPKEKEKLLKEIEQKQRKIYDYERKIAEIILTTTIQSGDIVTSVLSNFQMPNEETIELGNDNWNMKIKKISKVSLYMSTYMNGDARVVFPSVASNLLRGYKEKDVTLQIISSKENPISWGIDNGKLINSGILGIKLFDSSRRQIYVKNLTENIILKVDKMKKKRDIFYRMKAYDLDKRETNIISHNVSYAYPTRAINLKLVPKQRKEPLIIYVRMNEKPTSEKYDSLYFLPSNKNGFNQVIPVVGNGTCYIGVKAKNQISYMEYGISIEKLTCMFWSTTDREWKDEGCRVSDNQEDNSQVLCECNHLTFFGSNIIVAPNPIDFSSVFGKFKTIGDNIVVLAFIISILVLFWISLFILRKLDKSDEIKWSMRSLLDNSAFDTHHYALIVRIGYKKNSGTKSVIRFRIQGNEGSSHVRTLYDGYRQELRPSNIYHYHMTTNQSLGKPTNLQIWINPDDNNKYDSLLLEEIIVVDISTMNKHYFYVSSWLTETNPCLYVSTIEGKEILKSSRLWPMWLRRKLTDDHLWISVLSRPTRSVFNRLQRASCCLSLITTSMLASAMFYRTTKDESADSVIKFGPLKFSLQQLWIGAMSGLVVVPVNLLIVTIFRKCSRNPNSKEKKLLPSFLIFVAWLLIFLSVSTSCFFVLLYSLEWGKEKSEEWLTSMLVSFSQSVLLIQPLKVFALAFILSFIFKKSDSEIDDKEFLQHVENERVATEICSEYLHLRVRNTSSGVPKPSLEHMIDNYINLKQDKKAENAIFNIITALIYVFLLFFISYKQVPLSSFRIGETVRNGFIKNLDSISKIKDVYIWANKSFLPSMFDAEDYNGTPLHWREKRYSCFNGNMFRVGSIRWRQLRVSTEPCKQLEHVIKNCSYDLDSGNIDKTTIRDKKLPKYMPNPMKYIEGNDVITVAKRNSYPSGGYIFEHNTPIQPSNDWLDARTRAVIIESTLFNPNSNLFVHITIVIEQSMDLSINAWNHIAIIDLYPYNSDYGVFILIKKTKMKYFTNLWNITGITNNILCLAGLGLFITKLVLRRKVKDSLKDDFVDMQHLAIVNDFVLVNIVICLNFLMSILNDAHLQAKRESVKSKIHILRYLKRKMSETTQELKATFTIETEKKT
ncbi:DgyrCDS9629 [Dimorphilus gyrociliatus]|uniref:DgyrCDS9629 n=1 Tax=Dimorphilus gyrociliatus TaxID=2664684 RepID=A0A7I8VZ67_9ANNE|nr:DgyrCDS9629 [Dimorphilus gyrociliatus]